MHHLKCVRCLRKLGMWSDLGYSLAPMGMGCTWIQQQIYIGRTYNCLCPVVTLLLFGSVWTRAHYSGGMMEPPHQSSLGRLTKMGLIESRSRCFMVFQSFILDRSSYHSSSQWGERCNHSTYGAMEERLLLSIPCHQLAGIS